MRISGAASSETITPNVSSTSITISTSSNPMTPPRYVAPSSSWHWPEPLSRQTNAITGNYFGGGLFAELDMPEILAWHGKSRSFGVSVVQSISRPATNAIVPRKIPPPLYYSGPDFDSFSSPRKKKIELIIENFVT